MTATSEQSPYEILLNKYTEELERNSFLHQANCRLQEEVRGLKAAREIDERMIDRMAGEIPHYEDFSVEVKEALERLGKRVFIGARPSKVVYGSAATPGPKECSAATLAQLDAKGSREEA